MQALLGDLPFVRVYLDDILLLTNTSFSDHINKLEQVFICIKSAGLQCNAPKCNLAAYETEYLGYKLTQNGIKPLLKKSLQFNPSQSLKTKRNFAASLDCAIITVIFGLSVRTPWHL
jgi:hypothetical protein